MGRRNRDLPLLEKVTIADAGAEGMAVAKVDGLVVFVPFVVPGDVVDIQLYKKKKNYAEGRAVKFHSYSDLRVEARCPHYGVCGGCKWQTLRYESQLEAKQRQVRDNLERLGNVDCSGMRPICGSENIYYYRNKLEFPFSTKAWRTQEELAAGDTALPSPGALGFHIPQLFDKVLSIEHCALQQDPSNDIRLAVRRYAEEHSLEYYDIRNHTGFLRNLVIRNTSTGQWMDYTVDVAEDGLYSFDAEIASSSTGGMFHLAEYAEDNLNYLTEFVEVPKTGGTSVFKTLHGRLQMPLTAGRHVISLMIDTGGFYINKITFTRYEEAEGSCLLKAFNDTYGVGDHITVSARATARNSSVSEVRFYADNILIGTSTTSPYQCVFVPTEKRSYSMTAIAVNAEGKEKMSNPRILEVMGMPVGDDYRGIVIKNGKKYIKK